MVARKKTLDIYSVGTEVSLTENINAKIMSVSIHANDVVQYECAWWNGDIRTRDLFTENDFISVGKQSTPTKIGFNNIN
ncbi:hypothetical protein CMI37_33500 [Candidatus Pacearchaeota archaeon]|jgi:uncharacterized protein YodC (DUF2158 family)|nr:hypothetical protein [Candidatus Pacearchaeota archaeon]|tara:strand:- start:9418 stop:9654 length:237 start_codon:yes stop_codon:yes gene_type:complete